MRQKFVKKCKRCGKDFTTYDNSVEFCNLGCKEDFENPPVMESPEDKIIRKCKQCGKSFTVSKANRVYCSPECAQKAWRLCQREDEIKKPKKRFCLKCKTELTEEEYEEHRICRECRMKTIKNHFAKLKPKKKPVRKCAKCGTELPDGSPGFARYCRACKEKVNSEKEQKRKQIHNGVKRCVVCNAEFTPNGPRQKYCCSCGINMPHTKRNKVVKEMKKEEVVVDKPRNPVTHNYVDLRIDYENQLEQLKNARNDCIEQKKKSEEIIAWLTPKIELLDDVIDQMKKCEVEGYKE